jgi:TRAP-type transport system small permease protein
MTADDETRSTSPRLAQAAAKAAKIIAAISQWLNVVGMVVLGALIGITVVDVLGRSLFHKPILGTFELTEYMLAVIVFCTISWCAVTRSHITVDILTSHLPPRVNAVLLFITSLLGLGLLGTMMWQSFREALVITEMGKSSTMLNVPAYPFYWLMAIAFLIVSLQVLVEVVRTISKAVAK